MKLLSVLVAAYKAEKWLPQCIASIQGQKLPFDWEIELLVGVDACDATLAQARSCQDPNTRIYVMAENSGTYVTFNTLMKYARGELISRFDADDVMKPGFIAEQIERLEFVADVTMTWSIYTDQNLRPASYVKPFSNFHQPGGLRRKGSEGQIMMRHEVWQELGGFQPWKCGADIDFVKRARLAGFIIEEVADFLYYRRIHDQCLAQHPDTNFQSSYRKDVEMKRVALQAAYNKRECPLKLDPVTCPVEAVFE